MMILVGAPHLKVKVDLEKAVKMALIHDLVEIYAGDMPFHRTHNQPDTQEKQKVAEEKAILAIKNQLTPELGDEFLFLWKEFEERKSPEASYVYAFDKLEALIQYNEAPLEKWGSFEKEHVFEYIENIISDEPLINAIKDKLHLETKMKLNHNK